MTELPSREDFFNQLNTKFRIYFYSEQPTEVELIEVSELRRQPRVESFSLVFQAPETVPPVQFLYRVEHDALGAMELFLVPIEKNETGFVFEAVFNVKIKVSNG